MATRRYDEAIWYVSGDVGVSVLYEGGNDYDVMVSYEELREQHRVRLPRRDAGTVEAHRAAAQRAMNESRLAEHYAEWTGRRWALRRYFGE